MNESSSDHSCKRSRESLLTGCSFNSLLIMAHANPSSLPTSCFLHSISAMTAIRLVLLTQRTKVTFKWVFLLPACPWLTHYPCCSWYSLSETCMWCVVLLCNTYSVKLWLLTLRVHLFPISSPSPSTPSVAGGQIPADHSPVSPSHMSSAIGKCSMWVWNPSADEVSLSLFLLFKFVNNYDSSPSSL